MLGVVPNPGAYRGGRRLRQGEGTSSGRRLSQGLAAVHGCWGRHWERGAGYRRLGVGSGGDGHAGHKRGGAERWRPGPWGTGTIGVAYRRSVHSTSSALVISLTNFRLWWEAETARGPTVVWLRSCSSYLQQVVQPAAKLARRGRLLTRGIFTGCRGVLDVSGPTQASAGTHGFRLRGSCVIKTS